MTATKTARDVAERIEGTVEQSAHLVVTTALSVVDVTVDAFHTVAETILGLCESRASEWSTPSDRCRFSKLLARRLPLWCLPSGRRC